MFGYSRGEDDRKVGKRRETLANRSLVVLDCCCALVFYKVPLVYNYHKAFFILLDDREDIHVLRLDTAGAVEHEYTYVAGLDCTNRTNHRVVFDVFVYLVFLANTGGIYQVEVKAEFAVAGVDRIAGSTGYIGYDMAVSSDKGVDYRRLACVGAAYDSKLRNLIELVLVLLGYRQVFHYLVKQVAGTIAVDRRNGVRVAEAEFVEFGYIVDPLI